jgi:hypothetical protein
MTAAGIFLARRIDEQGGIPIGSLNPPTRFFSLFPKFAVICHNLFSVFGLSFE